MKKIFTVLATTVAISSPVLANENSFYGKLHLGGAMLNKFTDKYSGFKMKSSNAMFVDAGFGYYAADNLRVGLDFSYLPTAQMKKTVAQDSAKHKANIMAILGHTSIDLFDVSVAKVYATLNLGLAQVNNKYTYTSVGTPADNISSKSKKKYEFAYGMGVGTSMLLSDGMNLELQYTYRDLGKAKAKVAGITNAHYKGHFVSGGVRIDF
jgi:opacity protein-like surface antigen